MKLSKEFKIGALMLGAICVTAFGINFLKGANVFSKSKTFYGVYDKVSGLAIGNPVTVNGYQVGVVRSIDLYGGGAGRLLVSFSIDERDFDFGADTRARIESMDLLGSKTIALKLGESSELAESGDTLFSDIEADLMAEVNKQIGPLKLKAESLLGTVDSVMVLTEQLLREDARPNLAASFESIRRTLASIESTSSNLDGLLIQEKSHLRSIFANLESITSNFAENNEVLNNTIANFSQISDTLAQADIGGVVNDAALAVQNVAAIMDQINSGQGSLGLLLYNDSLYNNLTMASDNLDALLEDVRVNPKRYVSVSLIGRKDPSPSLTRKEKEALKDEIRQEMEMNK